MNQKKKELLKYADDHGLRVEKGRKGQWELFRDGKSVAFVSLDERYQYCWYVTPGQAFHTYTGNGRTIKEAVASAISDIRDRARYLLELAKEAEGNLWK